MGICVVGSINMDFIVEVSRFPAPGETIAGSSFRMLPGGKGANQAVALSRLGSSAVMAGKLGNDLFASTYRRIFDEEGVDASLVETESQTATGTAVIQVDGKGRNSIVISAGANGRVDTDYIDRIFPSLSGTDYFLFQFEIPAETNLHALHKCAATGKKTVVDPAPAGDFDPEVYPYTTILTPNEVEATQLSGMELKSKNDFRECGKLLTDRGATTVIIKAGGAGAYLVREHEFEHIPPYTVRVKDSTAAGDAFNAALAYGLSVGRELCNAVDFANAVGALACTQLGAQTALPTASEVAEFISGARRD